jgi:hypothetical protein
VVGPVQDGYQLTQALIAIGRGEWFGVGLGGSIQKLFYLPEAHTDFILAVLAEELGLRRGLRGDLPVRGAGVARVVDRAACVEMRRHFAGYCAFGIALWIGLQSMVSIGVNLGLLPTKGLTLPLISSGGSSVLMTCAATRPAAAGQLRTRPGAAPGRATARRGDATRQRRPGSGARHRPARAGAGARRRQVRARHQPPAPAGRAHPREVRMNRPERRQRERRGTSVMILAGGTGGHIFPGLAVAAALHARDVPVCWLGAVGGMENRLVPQHGIPIETIAIGGLRGKGMATLLRAPLRVARAVLAALAILRTAPPRRGGELRRLRRGPRRAGGMAARPAAAGP